MTAVMPVGFSNHLASTHFFERGLKQALRVVSGSDCVEAPCRVLFVDDEPEMRRTMESLFRHSEALRSYPLTVADSLNQAMALVVSNCFDIAILDYRLSCNETAADLVSVWRDHGYELPFICLSGYSGMEIEMRNIGASAFIHKSDLTPEVLALQIRIALGVFWRDHRRC